MYICAVLIGMDINYQRQVMARVIEAAGGQAALAKSLKVTRSAVNQWVHGLRPIPPKRCLAIQRITKNKVTVYDLLPEVFGTKTARHAA